MSRLGAALFILVGLPLAFVLAQRPGGGFGGGGFRSQPDAEGGHEREWDVDPDLHEDHFTFVRLRHSGDNDYGFTDHPRADENFTRRLQELTSMEVNPIYKNFAIDDPELFQYPFAFMSDMRWITFSPEEEDALRKYLTNGGFIMADDQWGDRTWGYVYEAMKGVFPDKEPVELDFKHPIFSCVFQLPYKPQVPSHDSAARWEELGIDNHYERKGFDHEDEEAMNTPRYWAWYDDDGRMMMLVCHNNDIADGWEEESDNPSFFKKYSEKLCFPLGINIVFYALTH